MIEEKEIVRDPDELLKREDYPNHSFVIYQTFVKGKLFVGCIQKNGKVDWEIIEGTKEEVEKFAEKYNKKLDL